MGTGAYRPFISHIVIQSDIALGDIIYAYDIFYSIVTKCLFIQNILIRIKKAHVIDKSLLIFKNGIIQYSRFHQILEKMAAIGKLRVIANLGICNLADRVKLTDI